MLLKHLRTFTAAAETVSFTQAARRLHITQAAVSQHIAALERECGAKLFDRAARSVALTEAGVKLRDYATRILELVEEATAVVGGTEPAVGGRLRIAASTVPAEQLLPKLLAEFRKQFPQIHESITISDSREALAVLKRGDADVALVGERIETLPLVFSPIAEDTLILVVSPQHEWAARQFVTPQSLPHQPLILRESGSGSRHCVEHALAQKGLALESFNIAMEVNSNDAIRAAVVQNAGVAFLSSLTAAADLEAGTLVRVRVRGLAAVRQLFLVTDPRRTISRSAAEFIQFVESNRD